MVGSALKCKDNERHKLGQGLAFIPAVPKMCCRKHNESLGILKEDLQMFSLILNLSLQNNVLDHVAFIKVLTL